MVQLSSPLLRYMTRKTYLFPQIRHVGFPKVAARQYADARAAMRDRQRGNTQIVWAPKNLQTWSIKLTYVKYTLNQAKIEAHMLSACTYCTVENLCIVFD